MAKKGASGARRPSSQRERRRREERYEETRDPVWQERARGSKRVFVGVAAAMVVAVTLIYLIPLAFILAGDAPDGGGVGDGGSGNGEEEGGGAEWVLASRSESFSGTAQENSEVVETVTADMERIASVNVTLTWVTDESSVYVGGTNYPDEMGLLLTSPSGQELEVPLSTTGAVQDRFTADRNAAVGEHTGDWTLTITCGECGDDVSNEGIRTSADTSADYACELEFLYYTEVEGE